MSLATTLLALTTVQTGAVSLQVDVTQNLRPISPYIYGTNQSDWSGRAKYLTFWRWGGNRITAYNWENNASNAGNDWNNQNDSFLGGGEVPGEAVRAPLAAALNAGAAALVSIPCAGYVAADKNGDGDVNKTPNYLSVRFNKSYASKSGSFSMTPDLTDKAVYQDEFVWWLGKTMSTKRPIWFALDNEPDLWASTHSRIWTTAPTYAQIFDISKQFGQAIKKVAPNSLVFGPASYGWNGFTSFQNASDANGRLFIDWYLQQFKALHEQTGKRVLDVLDLHWYPEAQGDGQRITNDYNSAAFYQARVQAPRSLWDPTYTETSWITQYSTHGPIKLPPLMQQKIATNYPGTKLAITEWNYGGGNHITGGVASADVLGIYGREGVYAAAYWPLGSDHSFAYGGFDMYRNFDGKGGHFGDTSVKATTSDVAKVTVYASTDTKDPSVLTVVAINKQDSAQAVTISIAGTILAKPLAAYQLTSAGSKPLSASLPTMAGKTASLTLPAMSVTTLRFARGGASRGGITVDSPTLRGDDHLR